MKKVIIGFVGILVIVGVLLGIVGINQWQENRQFNSWPGDDTIIEFYNNNKVLLNDIKDGLLSEKYGGVSIDKEGFFITTDGKGKEKKKWVAPTSYVAKIYFEKVDFPASNIQRVVRDDRVYIEFLAYYSTSQVTAGVVYTDADVSSNNQYQKIKGNWYLLFQEMA